MVRLSLLLVFKNVWVCSLLKTEKVFAFLGLFTHILKLVGSRSCNKNFPNDVNGKFDIMQYIIACINTS